jgi:hypothetical protein
VLFVAVGWLVLVGTVLFAAVVATAFVGVGCLALELAVSEPALWAGLAIGGALEAGVVVLGGFSSMLLFIQRANDAIRV